MTTVAQRKAHRTHSYERDRILGKIAELDEHGAKFGLSGEGKAIRAQLAKDLDALDFTVKRDAAEIQRKISAAVEAHDEAFEVAWNALEAYVNAAEDLLKAREAARIALIDSKFLSGVDVPTAQAVEMSRLQTPEWRKLQNRFITVTGRGARLL